MRDPEILAQCLVEGDAARVDRFRRLRRQAVLLSVAVEAMLLAALLLAPLATPGTLPRHLDGTPMPPFGGSPHAGKVAPHPHGESGRQHESKSVKLYQPNFIPHALDHSDDQTAEDVGPLACTGSACGNADGPPIGVPYGIDPGIRIPTPEPPKPPVERPRTIPRSEGVQSALLAYRVVPAYPILARQTRTEGEVKLHAIISTDGKIRSLEVQSGHPFLVQAALDAVRQWRYKPALLSGQPVEVDTFITVIFHLER